MDPRIVNPVLIVVQVYIFFASIYHSLGSPPKAKSVSFFGAATLLRAPVLLIMLAAAFFPNGSPGFLGGLFVRFIGPFLALAAIICFCLARKRVGGWKSDALALATTLVFGGIVFGLTLLTSWWN